MRRDDQRNHRGLEKKGFSKLRKTVFRVPEVLLQLPRIAIAHQHFDHREHTKNQNHQLFFAWIRLDSSVQVRGKGYGCNHLEKKELQGCSFLVLDKRAQELRLQCGALGEFVLTRESQRLIRLAQALEDHH